MSVQPRFDRLLADVGHAHADHQRHGERAAHYAATEFAVPGVLLVEVHRVRVHRKQRERDVVVLGDRAPGAMLVDVADPEVLEIAPERLAVGALADLLRFA